MNQGILLPYTELSEDHVQQILNIDPSQKLPQILSCNSQLFRRQFFSMICRAYAAMQHFGRIAQQFAVPLPTDQRVLAATEICPREIRNFGNQSLYPLPLRR